MSSVTISEQDKEQYDALGYAVLPNAIDADTLQMLREEGSLKDLPVILITGLAPDQAHQVVPEDSRTKLLFKPVNAESLLAAARELIERHEKEMSATKKK